jgi:hypothetical protein
VSGNVCMCACVRRVSEEMCVCVRACVCELVSPLSRLLTDGNVHVTTNVPNLQNYPISNQLI